MRLEHWTNAADQGVAAARRLLHGDGPGAPAYAPVPFVWSDQYDLNIQSVGHFSGDDEMHVVHGTLAERRFTAIFGRNGRLVGALGFGMPAKVMQYRRQIEEGSSLADALAWGREHA
jgi:NADPH-dependent 2,4-dienoyl-CoA reductase/sulfur reductase-like enzyme